MVVQVANNCLNFSLLFADVLTSRGNRTGITLTIEGGNETFVGSLNCADGHTAQGFLNCTRNENGSVIVVQHGPLVCVMPQSYPPCGEICIVFILAIILFLLLIWLIILVRILLALVPWSHNYYPSVVGKYSCHGTGEKQKKESNMPQQFYVGGHWS